MDWLIHMPIWMAILIAVVGCEDFLVGEQAAGCGDQAAGNWPRLRRRFAWAGGPNLSERSGTDAPSDPKSIITAIDDRDWNSLSGLLDANTVVGTISADVSLAVGRRFAMILNLLWRSTRSRACR